MESLSFSIDKVLAANQSRAATGRIEATTPGTPALIDALLGGTLPSADIVLGHVELAADATFTLGAGKSSATFGAEAGAHGRFGLYADAADVKATLKLDDAPIGGLDLPGADAEDSGERRFGLMEWGYRTAFKGGIALQGQAAPTLGGRAARNQRFVVIRHLRDNLKGTAFVDRMLDGWVLPSRVDSATSLKPRTWVLSEVDGSIGIKVGAQYGYALDWVREAEAGGLKGDLGLKIQAGIDVSLGFSSAGRYMLVLSRPTTAPTIRVQVFKMKRKGWDFALNAHASVETIAELLPANFDDFLSGVFGIDGSQLLADLDEIKKATTDPAEALKALLGETPSVETLVSKLAPGSTLADRYRKAWSKIDRLLGKWDKLGHDTAALLWAKLGHEAEVQAIRSAADELGQLEGDALRARIIERVEGSALGSDAVLQWLSSVVDGDLLSAVTRSSTVKKVGTAARRTTALLDPNALGDALDSLHTYVGERLNIDQVRSAVAAGSLDELDTWLTTKLEGFVERALDVDGLREVGKVIDLLQEKAPEFYAKARASLNQSYGASFALAYKGANERTALVDVEINGSHADSGALLKQAIEGDFGRFLLKSHPAVTLRTGALTHGIERQTSVSVSLPFFDRNETTLTKSLAKVAVSDEPGGRVAFYSLDAENTVTRDNEMRSRFSISSSLRVPSNRVRSWSTPEWLTSYEYAHAFPRARRAVLENRLEPLVRTYFEKDFPVETAGESGTLSTWLDDWDSTIGAIADNGSDNFGNTVLRLSVALPASLGDAWAQAPGQKKDPKYFAMSLAMQETMRRVMLRTSESRPSFYEKRVEAASLLVYSALPPAHGASIRRTGLFLRGKEQIHWDWTDPELLVAMLNQPQTLINLSASFTRIHRRLRLSGEVPPNHVSRYEPTNKRIEEALQLAFDQRKDLVRLLRVERATVKAAQEAGQSMALFRRQANSDAAEAVAALAGFGKRTTEAFNKDLKKRFGTEALPALSAELFAAAARAFVPATRPTPSLAMLEVFAMREGRPFPPADLGRPPVEDVMVAQRFVRG